MKKAWMTAIIVVANLLAASLPAAAGEGRDVTRFYVFTGIESHSKVRGIDGEFGGETYVNTMLSLSRKLQKDVYGNIYYLHSYSVDDGDTAKHAAGANVTRILNKHLLWSVSYSFTDSPERGVVVTFPESDNDRFSTNLVYTFNPEEKEGVRYISTTRLSTVSNFSDQQAVSEKIAMRAPLSRRFDGELSYRFSYSLDNSEQLTNQFGGKLKYKWTKRNRLALDVLFIDNVYENNAGDDTMVLFSMLSMID